MAISPSDVNLELPYRPDEPDLVNRKSTRFRNYMAATENMLLLFEPDIGVDNNPDAAEIGRDLNKLELDFTKLKRLQLQRQHFEACIEKRVIPRGLRVLKMPTSGNNFPELLLKWQQLNLELSFNYMRLLNEFHLQEEETLRKNEQSNGLVHRNNAERNIDSNVNVTGAVLANTESARIHGDEGVNVGISNGINTNSMTENVNDVLVENTSDVVHIVYEGNNAVPVLNTGNMAKDNMDIRSEPLFHYIKNVHFWNKNGEEVLFDINGDPPAMFSIVNWQVTSENSFRYQDVGRFDATAAENQKLTVDIPAILWNEGHGKIPQSFCSESCSSGYRKVPQPGQPICCFSCIMCSQGEISNQTNSIDCLKCPKDGWPNERKDKCIKKVTEFLSYEEPLGSALTAVSIFLETTTAIILTVFIKYHHTPVVKANNQELSYCLLFSLMLCFVCSFIFIGHPTHVTCMLRQNVFGTIFTLAISCVLAKTVVVVIAFNASKPNSNLRKYTGPRLPKVLVMLCTSIQIIICASWLIISPPFQDENAASETGRIIIECNEGSPIAFWYMMSYMGLLAVVSLVVAFLSRKLPDSFNEAKFITFSMLVFVCVWLSFIPAYLSTQGKYTVAVEIFAIVSSGGGLLLCIFAPKCYIILFRPDMNTRDYLMGKGAFKNSKD
ncbi:vomeronasal type-2 receptor 26-like [Protopterus annectens]|uniref:vomeronasal type-2 receptor 26-like n=1 Tax=Protopterus annectens TaxID=7888 RepID=UPI001CF9E9E5|nr:vomeronasal type-2 receptor 26-like [Protopterus annectens]